MPCASVGLPMHVAPARMTVGKLWPVLLICALCAASAVCHTRSFTAARGGVHCSRLQSATLCVYLVHEKVDGFRRCMQCLALVICSVGVV